MPELPEVQAHAERLEARFAGAVLAAFTPLSFAALKTVLPPPDDAVGHALTVVRRRAKLLVMQFAEAPTFVVHLMQGGRLKDGDVATKKPRGALARWTFADGRALLLTEGGTERKAGVWVVAGDPEDSAPLAGLGPEAHGLDAALLGERLQAASARVHTALRDQHVVAGLGRRLANEVCHRAQLSPFATTRSLDEAALQRLADAIRGAIDDSLAHERTLDAMTASKDRPGLVHHRTGEPCLVCGDVIRAVEYRDYTVEYCATCQTGGKVLADNTTSKFLR